MAIVTFQQLVCDSSLGTVKLSFSNAPFWGPSGMTAGVPVNLGNPQHSYTFPAVVTLSVTTNNGSTINQNSMISTTPGSKNLRFSLLGATYFLSCQVT